MWSSSNHSLMFCYGKTNRVLWVLLTKDILAWEKCFTEHCLPHTQLHPLVFLPSAAPQGGQQGLGNCLLTLTWDFRLWSFTESKMQNRMKDNSISSLFTGSVQLNQEWEAWMGSVSMLCVSTLMNERLALSLLSPSVPWRWPWTRTK